MATGVAAAHALRNRSAAVRAPAGRFPALAELIRYLDGLTARADLRILRRLLARLVVTRRDLEPACRFGVQAYRRNPVARSDWYELLVLCWRSGHGTPIHDHRGSSCAFRVIEGVGTEIRFERTASGHVCPIRAISMEPGYVCAAQDDMIHQVANFQAPGRNLITLHIYSPPIRRMHTYAYAAGACPEPGV